MAQSVESTAVDTVRLGNQASSLFSEGKAGESIDVLNEIARATPNNVKVEVNLALARFLSTGCAKPSVLVDDLGRVRESITKAIHSSKDGKGKPEEDVKEEPEFSMLAYNQAVAYFSMRQYSMAAGILEHLFKRIEPVDEWAAMRLAFLLLDVYIVAYRGCVADDQDLRPTLEKAQDVFAFLDKPHVFNNFAASSGDGGAGGGSAGADSAPDLDGGASGSSAAQPLQAQVAEFRFRLHLYKARFALLVGNVKLAKKEVKAGLEVAQKPKASGKAAVDPDVGDEEHCSKQQSVCAFVLKANMECRLHNTRKAIRLLGYASAAMDSCLVAGSKDFDHSRAMYLHNVGCVFFRMNRFAAAAAHFSRALELCEPWRQQDRWGGTVVPRPGTTDFTIRPPGRSSLGLGVSAGIPSPVYECLYNCGLSLLKDQKPGPAFRCFYGSLELFRTRSRVWLRLAECCILQHAQDAKAAVEKDAPSWSHWTSKGVVRTAVGAGRLHRFILQEPWTAARDGVEDIAAAVASLGAGVSGGSSGSGAGPSGAGSAGSGGAALPVEPPQPSLAFAALCLRNALSLLPPVSSFAPPSPADASAPVASSVDSLPFATAGALHASVPRTDAGPVSAAGSAVDARKKPADGEDDGTAGAGADSASDPKDSKAVPPKSKLCLRQAALAKLSFVYLNLDDPVSALSCAAQVLALPNCQEPWRFVARMYASEALATMSRLSEALACLNVDCLASVRAAAATLASASAAATPVATRAAGSATTSVGPQLGPTPDSAHVIAIEEASCALHVNLGIVQLAMGDAARASESASLALGFLPASPDARRLAVCVALFRGDHAGASALLRCPVPVQSASGTGAASGGAPAAAAAGRGSGVRGK